ncbi:MFS transporter [Pikeienuella piscinae]|uniref:MFS transporter n=1 Tax=Pikeienuella piscinae TaxID=2748098 RepID=A0A7L5C009_9RHOB|nr:MFS transporter [Pikeienuella piscinae]QIE55189.1 MFS transporter [Pikeienuella piscinae]
MTLATETQAHTEILHDDRRARRNVVILAAASAFLGAQMPVHFVLGGLSGQLLATDKSFATLPISATVFCSMLAAPLIALLMGRFGRRAGFMVGVAGGATGATLNALALIQGSFALFLIGSALFGLYMAAQGQYRFAAADTASPAYRPKAISLVMAGGLASAVLGPQVIVPLTRDLLAPIPFAGAYATVVALNLVAWPIIILIDIPRPRRRAKSEGSGRPLREILAVPRVRAAIICAMVSYALMNLVMTAAPLAVVGCGFSPDMAGTVVMAHVLAMFAPSFFTGHLIARFGAERIVATGLALLGVTALVSFSGTTGGHFIIALVLLGLGWNFGFIGATDMLTSSHEPEERAKLQGLNDFLVFGLVTVASLSSGALLNGFGNVVTGWNAVNAAVAPFLTLAAGALIWLAWRRRSATR